ncbi:hypothetical protein LPW36_10110 [Jinshanibacter sp. LJY008]|uniref:Uncharacterized protein n=1 Tax=Limnobaculum eriocheiris TaxID=2897391 RepID=A0A9X1SLL1_9GAMM|nr:hypothetical protein [Limnobaculum eriocheiris]MCD1126349.1 hypothetical protein [Limnobaculum eriocheiris]
MLPNRSDCFPISGGIANAAFGYDPYVGWSFGFIAGWAWASAWYGPSWGPWYDWDGPTP